MHFMIMIDDALEPEKAKEKTMQATPPGVSAMLQKIQELLLKRGETVASAESCTGGMIATALTHLPGSSAVYVGGICAYDNSVKIDMLGVAKELIARHGAVSSAVAEAMAGAARRRLEATYAVATTGIAGPSGGTVDKPVGTVYCSVAGPSGIRSVKWALNGDREKIRTYATARALGELLSELTPEGKT